MSQCWLSSMTPYCVTKAQWVNAVEKHDGRQHYEMNFPELKHVCVCVCVFQRKLFPCIWCKIGYTLQWHHNGRDGVSNHQSHDCLLNRLFRRRSKKISKLRVTSHCTGNSPATGEFPVQMASNAENVSIWWRHHEVWHAGCVVYGIQSHGKSKI